MTQQDQQACRKALWNCRLHEYKADADSLCWAHAIRQTRAYYEGEGDGTSPDPVRAGILELRYRRHLKRVDVQKQLNLCSSTYKKATDDLLSTLGIYAARLGIL